MYKPPFEITSRIVNLIAEISAMIERYAIHLENEGLKLRKANRIRTIHSSLAIEGNNLSETQVQDIINGKAVVAPIKEIQEVKNAIKTYESYNRLNPFKIDDILYAHSLMMNSLIEDAGSFRKGNVGVFSEKGLVHMAPPANRVPELIENLFSWLNSSEEHLLIRSCVFHYEFEFIHPFSDGNGRIGRLWQSLILGKLHPIFENLPVENMVFSNQEEYYKAISESNITGNSSPFIEFMLNMILTTLKDHQKSKNVGINVGENVGINNKEKEIIKLISENNYITIAEVASVLSLSQRQAERIFSSLKKNGIIARQGSSKKGFWILVKEIKK